MGGGPPAARPDDALPGRVRTRRRGAFHRWRAGTAGWPGAPAQASFSRWRAVEIALQRPLARTTARTGRAGASGVAVVEPARLYREHGDALFRYLVRMSGDADLAADVLQDTFVRLVEKPPRTADHLKAWLFQVATNRLRDLRRKQVRREGLTTEELGRGALADPPAPPDRMAEQAEARETVLRALDTLSERDRTILLMREEGFVHREIAEVVGTTTGSVGTLIARALDKLARSLEAGPGAGAAGAGRAGGP